ncbi:unnamed protein product [marine sediment metagenome]|uniref:ParB/Sulfiredoxin domain-containing protein n=1 Tax=marine sediment metagenome TaxID=412755 RepID=X0RZP7_9ZZZZ
MAKKKARKAKGPKNRVVGLEKVKGHLFDPHPDNVAIHPAKQVSAYRELLLALGFAGAITARKVKGRYQILDGHMRVGLDPEYEYPTLILDLTKAEARTFLLTFDPLKDLSKTDMKKLSELADKLTKTQRGAVRSVVNLKSVAQLSAAEDELKAQQFAGDKLQKKMEETGGVALQQERKNFWVYVDFDGFDEEMDGLAYDIEQEVLGIMGTGRSRGIDPAKFLEAVALYAKKHKIKTSLKV